MPRPNSVHLTTWPPSFSRGSIVRKTPPKPPTNTTTWPWILIASTEVKLVAPVPDPISEPVMSAQCAPLSEDT